MRQTLSIFKGGRKQTRAVSDVPAGDQERQASSDASSSNPPSVYITDNSGSLTRSRPGPSFPDGVKVWHDCPDATVDICFVHGLTGNRDNTWLANGQSVPWPKTLLSPELPRARLLTYGYDAYIVRKSAVSTNRLIDHATNLLNDLTNDRATYNASSRRLIFVAHSLGGIVCKEAILLSRNNPEPHLRGIFACIVGVIFLGTPHKGSWMADWARIPTSALTLLKSSNKSLLATLETENQLLELVQIKFLSMVRELREGGRRLQVTCFFEELPLPIAGHVVPKEYATIEGYTSVSVHANHRDMVRFASSEDTGFKRLLGELKRWLVLSSEHAAQGVMPSRLASPHAVDTTRDGAARPCYYIPFSKNKRFIGREETLDQLRNMLFVENENQRAAVAGLGGVGKTQVALKFAHWVKEDKPEYSVFWVPALSRASFEQAYVEIAGRLPIREGGEGKDLKESVRQYLSSKAAGLWLLVVDNADDMDMLFGSSDGLGGSIGQYLPESEDGLILFTTRSREVAVSAAGSNVVELEEMNSREAASLLEKLLVRKDLLCDEAATTELLRELTYLPLAITQAAAYLNRNRVSITEYLGLLRGTEQDIAGLMSREFYDSTRYRGSQNTVATTWLVSFDQIRKFDRAAADLLSFMSCVEPKNIPQSILPALESEEQMVYANGTLCGYAFVSRRDGRVFDMHSLVHLAIRIWIQREGLAAQTTEKVIRHMCAVFPSDDFTNRNLWREYLPHALRILKGEGPDIRERYDLCIRVGQCLLADGRIKEGVVCVEEFCRWRTAHFPEGHPSRLASQHALASAYLADKQVKKAITLLEQVVADIGKMLTEDHLERLTLQYALARAYEADGLVKKAVELLEQVATTREELPMEYHPSWLASQHELAKAYRADGQAKKAVTLHERVMAVIGSELAEDHSYRLVSQHTLAVAYLDNNQTEEAIELLEHVVAIRKTTLAEDHPDRLTSQHELALAYLDNDQTEEAIELLEHVVRIQKTALAEDHPNWFASQNVLAEVYLDNGQAEEAIKLLEHITVIQKPTLAEDHPNRLRLQHMLAVAYLDNDQIEEAIKLLEHVVAIQKTILAEDDANRLGSEHMLAVAYLDNDQTEEAIELLKHVVVSQKTVLAEEEPSRLGSEHMLAVAYLDSDQAEEAIKLLEHVVAIQKTTLAEDDLDRLGSEHMLAVAYFDNHQTEVAVQLLEQVVAIQKIVLAEDDLGRLGSEHMLAVAYLDNDQTEEAIKLLEHVVAIQKATLAEDHPARLKSECELARALQPGCEHVTVEAAALPETAATGSQCSMNSPGPT